MRIKATDPASEKVVAVLVDGKRVAMPLEADDVEGWCIAVKPVQPNVVHEITEVDTKEDNPMDAAEAEWDTVKLEGKVEIILAEDEDESVG